MHQPKVQAARSLPCEKTLDPFAFPAFAILPPIENQPVSLKECI